MHGVKVYLKSGRDRLYRGMVSLSGAVLVLVAFLLAQANPGLGLYYLGYGVPILNIKKVLEIAEPNLMMTMFVTPKMQTGKVPVVEPA